MEENGDSWSEGLKHVIFSMNTSTSATTTKTPYEVVFGQPPRSYQAEMEILANQGIVTEEDVPEGFFADDIQAEHLASSNDNSPEDNNPEMNENDTAAVQQVKRGLNFILLCNNGIVATATQLTGMTRFDGNPFNTTTHAVMSVNDIIDPTHVPVEGNPEKLPLEVGQFLLWKLDDLIRDEEEDTAHREVRLCARQGFLKAARRQLGKYETLCGDREKDYAVDQTVGIKIQKEDRTKIGAHLILCKVFQVRTDTNMKKQYKLYSATGVIKNWFGPMDLMDINNANFPDLNQVDPNMLPIITIVQASRGASNWQSGPQAGPNICNCKGSCINNRCCCKKAGLKCLSKCHTSHACQNVM